MRIQIEKNVTTFREVKPGEIFLWMGICLMRLDSGNNLEGVNITNGVVYQLHEDSQVQLVNAEITINL